MYPPPYDKLRLTFLQATTIPDEVEQVLLQQGVVSHSNLHEYYNFIEGVDSLKDVSRRKIELYKCSSLGIHLLNENGDTIIKASYYDNDYIGCIVK